MTMLLAVNFGDYGIMASDKSAMDNNGIMVSNKENKMIKTQIGYITGTGFVPLLDNVKNKLKEKEISSTANIVNLINEEKKIIESNIFYKIILPDLSKVLDKTGFLFSYETKVGLKIGLQYPDWIIGQGGSESESINNYLSYEKECFVITPPSDYCNKTYKLAIKRLEELTKEPRNKDNEERVVKEIFKMMADKSSQMTEDCDLVFI